LVLKQLWAITDKAYVIIERMTRLPSNGYTILEVSIFLAISGVLFVGAMVAIGGRQQAVQYTQAVRDFELQIRDVANDVSDGYYPDFGDGSCTVSGGAVTFDLSATSEPGTNPDCIKIGKIMMFNLDSEEVGLGTIVGVNPGLGEQNNLSLTALGPTLGYEADASNTLDMTVYKPIRFGAEVTKIALVSDPSITFSSLSFVSGFSASDSSRKENGLLATNVYGVKGSLDQTYNNLVPDYADEVEDLSDSTRVEVNKEFYVCLKTTDGKIARVFVGVDGVPTATKTEYDMNSGSVCP
jgi:hypothetical protein